MATYGMQIKNADNLVEFDSTSFGGVPISKHKRADGTYLNGLLAANVPLTTTVTNPLIYNYSDYPGRIIKFIPFNSGDTYYKVIQPNETVTGFTPEVNYARIAFFTNSDFTPTLATHGFERIETQVLVLLT
jgi:hypothetical protein